MASDISALQISVPSYTRLRNGRVEHVRGYERSKVLQKRLLEAIAATKGLDRAEKAQHIERINVMLEEYATLNPSLHARSQIVKAFGEASGLQKYYPAVENLKNRLHGLPTRKQMRKQYD